MVSATFATNLTVAESAPYSKVQHDFLDRDGRMGAMANEADQTQCQAELEAFKFGHFGTDADRLLPKLSRAAAAAASHQ